MGTPRNYLFGFGERLTEPIAAPGRPMTKFHPYTIREARARLAPRLEKTASEIEHLPAKACPNEESVAAVTLHPSYLAKTFFPTDLFRSLDLAPVGSRPRRMEPEKPGGRQKKKNEGGRKDALSTTVDVFVAGQRAAFDRWAEEIPNWPIEEGIRSEIIRIEDVRWVPPVERIKPMRSRNRTPLLEVVLHRADDYILEGFRDYLSSLGVRVDLDQRIVVQNLCFLPVRVPEDLHERVAQFSFLRVVREMPGMRELRPAPGLSLLRSAAPRSIGVPPNEPVNSEIRVAIFDGGVPKDVLPETLVRRKKTNGLSSAAPQDQEHGLSVTSAFLFGSLEDRKAPQRPFAAVDHYRVIDRNTAKDPQGEYFEILTRIMAILNQNHFEFVNFSLGPDLPVEDDEVHVWTASLDAHFSSGKTFVTVAAGNSGENDWALGHARIQAPADGVNILAVGSSDGWGKNWRRATYSSIGPGRRPGIIKPDILAFGGSAARPFWVLAKGRPGYAIPTQGTSFSAPNALRTAVGIRAYLGPVVKAVGLKALLIHHSRDGGLAQREVGWGKIPSEIEDLITCSDDTAHVLYQGTLDPSSYMRLRVPLPAADLTGKVKIAATFCYATEVDPQDPLSYTRSGLEVTFRPNKARFSKTPLGPSKRASTKTFFSCKQYSTEDELRHDAHKWETCLKAKRNFLARTLNDPVFDVHYNSRFGGAQSSQGKPIEYALVVTVQAKNVTDLYNKIAQRYRTQLEPLKPVIQIPIRTR
jgi:subtilase family protein